VVTKKARALLEQHGLSAAEFAGLAVVRASDVEEYLARRGTARPPARRFRDEELDPSADWDALLRAPEYARLRELLTGLRKPLRAKFNRHVPTGSLLYDRWD